MLQPYISRKQVRRVFQVALVALVSQFIFPHFAMAQAIEDKPELAADVTIILPVGQPLNSAVPLARVVPAPKPVVPTPKVVKVKTVVMTAYSSTRDQTDGDPFTTASGQKVKDGIIAMNGVPFGTKVRIPEKFGSKVFVVQDRMHARYGSSRGDIWMKTRNDAKQWGVKRVKVEILR
ncbi:MAG: 3D domain-containing protein [bacterium]|nr:3D domain-containing protein [bacterium]